MKLETNKEIRGDIIFQAIVGSHAHGTNIPESRVQSSPEEALPIATVLYNSDVYSTHCRKYKEYQEWLQNRNTQRYVDIEGHQQMIDGKNMLHCIRLIEMGKELAEGKGFNVRRPNADYLISIRKGKVSLKDLMNSAEGMLKEMDELYKTSTLPNKCDREFLMKLLVEIRKEYYDRSK